jgi:hypothetical protein
VSELHAGTVGYVGAIAFEEEMEPPSGYGVLAAE